MSKYYGTLQSERSTKTSTGDTHIRATAQSWNGSVSVVIAPDALGKERAVITVGEGSTDGPSRIVWSGYLEELLGSPRLDNQEEA